MNPPCKGPGGEAGLRRGRGGAGLRSRRVACLLIAVALLGTCLGLTGCWSRLETSEIAVVDGYGFDWQNGEYRVVASVFNPRALSAPGQTAPQPAQPATLFVTGTGPSPGAAIADVDRHTSRRVLWGSALVLLVGEALARHGIQPLVDAVTHEPFIRPTVRVIIVRGDAAALLGHRQSAFETSISRYLYLAAQTAHRQESVGWAPHIWDLMRWEYEKGRAPLVLGLRYTHPAEPRATPYDMGESAVLQGWRLAGWLPRDSVRASLWMTGLFVHGDVTFPCPAGHGDRGVVEVLQARNNTTPVVSGGVLTSVRVDLKGTANVLQACPGVGVAALDRAASAAVVAQARAAVDWAQRHGTDIFGWGNALYRRDPAAWERVAARWRKTFARLPVRITAEVRIAERGMTR